MPTPHDAPDRSPVLRVLRVGLHVMFAVLLALGLVRAFFPAEAMTAPPMHRMLVITLLCAVLALVYVVGTSREYQWQQRDPDGKQDRSQRLEWAWLGVITVL